MELIERHAVAIEVLCSVSALYERQLYESLKRRCRSKDRRAKEKEVVIGVIAFRVFGQPARLNGDSRWSNAGLIGAERRALRDDGEDKE